ncbi:MAG TPA: bifunctional precorrin-2 dehydrogenase/sirohydrochlorin ferrochelatase [Acidimicrobiales bacterium]|nr:bifunctional precorrin-2 dehydrogenase/sirohydrochlorin ferrochelatase [Acidimicrobiales bacterium]
MTDGLTLFPIGLLLQGQRCLVVGGGSVAARKIRALLDAGAAVTVVAPEAHEAVAALAATGALDDIDEHPLDLQLRPYERGEAAGYRLVLAATGDPAVDGEVHADAEAAGVWINSADDTDHCSALLPAVHRDGPVTVAVSTGGASPALASWLRDRLATALGPGLAELAALLAEGRRQLRDQGRSTSEVDWRGLLDGPFPDLVAAGRINEARQLMGVTINSPLQ